MTDTAPPPYGLCEWLAPGLRRVIAANPSAFTGWGTNSYILGEGAVTLIDPGPPDRAHHAALLAALAPGERIARIVVTHSHLDHSPLARPLAEAARAPVLAFGATGAGDMARIGDLGGGEGRDDGFVPDESLPDGAEIDLDGGPLRVLHTPGHFGNHICLEWGGMLFSGDHVMGWSTSIVSPPDGDMGAYMASLRRLQGQGFRRMFPGHGAPIEAPEARLAELIAHREGREAQILSALAERPADAATLAARIYRDIPPALLPAAARNVLAHLLDLADRGLAAPIPEGPPLTPATRFALRAGG
ncbi:MBL fold metallo-hydrolase [Ruixingdingia sedimenti]|uniref:MBL fold metallo-hydrolase n=1 Tax=Ruixingdingia sedimenti TaxID=3073604 RepID=A0ABU1F4P3_9RHOB|nr:MBL fold metallo-hydrolase [Xinfangfangia sp. LG-4]MDR5651831.1 MBL fold metallo-hydrolase [Xinfangfangia sp. LG-4]